jgi:hypothetical protein
MVSAFSVWGEEGKRGRDKEVNMGVGGRSRKGRDRGTVVVRERGAVERRRVQEEQRREGRKE